MCPHLPPKGTRFRGLPVLFWAACLAGCGSTPKTPVNPALSDNWQIQVGTSITSPPTGMYILGAIQTEGSQVTGIFSNYMPCSPATSTYTGSMDSSGDLTLTAPFDQAKILVPAIRYAMTTGTLSGGGYLCNVVGGGAAVAIEIPPFNGTYSGTLTASASSSGTAVLTVAQAATPNAAGQFPVTGTLQFTATGCSSTSDVTGTISGTVVKLTAAGATIAAYDNAAGAALPTTLTFAAAPCNAAPFTGTLSAPAS